MRTLRILGPTRYPWNFNRPHGSRHQLEARNFIPINKLSAKFEGITLFRPSISDLKIDLIHAFNRIPLGVQPYVIGFESHLPRAFFFEHSPYYKALQHSLMNRRCRGIFAISEHAQYIFKSVASEWPEIAEKLDSKLSLRYPNIIVPSPQDHPRFDVAKIVFVGSHFARKGGCVAVVLAEIARARDIPVHINIISNLDCGGGIWTDPPEASFFEPYIKLLDAPNISHHPLLPNDKVLEMFSESNFGFLPTFSDTFGYSVIESMARSTPVIGTRQGALPELIEDGRDGILLDLPTTDRGEWIYSAAPNRDSEAFKRIYTDEIHRLAEEALERIISLLNAPKDYAFMRDAAREKVMQLCDHTAAREFWDDIYERAVN